MTGADPFFATTRRRALTLGGVALGAAGIGGVSFAGAQDDDNGDDDDGNDGNGGDGARNYRVTVTNLTPGQPFTPPAVSVHRPDVEVFAVSERANEPTQQVAEDGNLSPLLDLLQETNSVRDAAVGHEPLVPTADPGDTGHPYYAPCTSRPTPARRT